MGDDAEEARPSVKLLRKLLNAKLKVQVSDGRTMVGYLQCYDQQGNMILSCTQEYLQHSSDVRGLGQVLILAKHRVSCEVEASSDFVPAMQNLKL